MAFLAVAREEGRVVSLVVTTIVRTDITLLARTKIGDRLVESMMTMNEYILPSIMDIVAGFHQSRKVAPGPVANVPTSECKWAVYHGGETRTLVNV
jgi:hypothetical protein